MIERSSKTRSDVISTGFPGVDRILAGGLQRANLAVLGGDVGSGKSSLSLAMALRAATRGAQAAFLTAEMPVDAVRTRILSIEARVTPEEIRSGSLSSGRAAVLEELAQALPGRGPIIRTLQAGAGVEHTSEIVRGLDGIDLVVVDNLQAISSARRGSEDEEASTVRHLKSLAVDLGMAILLVSHVAPGGLPGGGGRRWSLQDFSAQGAISQHADVVMLVHREELYDDHAGVQGAAELHVLKNRHGKPGYADLFFYGKWLRFEDMVEPDDEVP